MLLAIALLCALDFCAGNIFRRWIEPALGRREPASDEGLYRCGSPVYHHDLVPNVAVKRAFWRGRYYPVSANSLGFRDRTVRTVELKAARRRILVLGDSFAEGVGVEYPQTCVGIIEESLAAKRVEVLNAAVASYSPTIHLAKARHLLQTTGLQFQEAIVFLDIVDVEDELFRYDLNAGGRVVVRPTTAVPAQAHEAFKRSRRTAAYQFFLENSAGFRLFGVELPRALWRKDYAINLRPTLWTFDERLYEELGKPGLALMRQRMDALVALVKPRGIKLTVVVYPWPDQIYYRDVDSRHARFWRQWAVEQGVGFVNLFPAFIQGGNARAALDRLFLPADGHWNEAGHRLAAENILRDYGRGL